MSFVNVTSDSVCPAVTSCGATTPRATIIANVIPKFTTNLLLNMVYLSTESASDDLQHRQSCRGIPTTILEQSGGKSTNYNLTSVAALTAFTADTNYLDTHSVVFIARMLSPGTDNDSNRSPKPTWRPMEVRSCRFCCHTTNKVLPGRHSHRKTTLLRNERTLNS